MTKFVKFASFCNDKKCVFDFLKHDSVLKTVGYVFHRQYSSGLPQTRKFTRLLNQVDTPPVNKTRSFLSESRSSILPNRVIGQGEVNLSGQVYQVNPGGRRKSLRSQHNGERGMTLEEHHMYRDMEAIENTGWLIKLANENSYLSWCRNAYIASMVSATTYLQITVPYSKDVAFLFFLMAGGHLVCGTISYLYHITSLRKKMHMSKLSVLLHHIAAFGHVIPCLGLVPIYLRVIEYSSISLSVSVLLHYIAAFGHVMLWVGAVAIYIGYIEEVDSEEKVEE